MTTITVPNTPYQTLLDFGLEARVARLYLALLELGEASVLSLSKHAGVERTVIYYLLNDLRQLGLIKEVRDERNRLRLLPNPPERLSTLAAERQERVEAALPDLKALYNERHKNKPLIQLYEGLAGIDTMYDDVIASMKKLPEADREVLTYISMDLYSQLPVRNQESFREQRKRYHIRMRALSEESQIGQSFQERDVEELRQIKFIPERKQPFLAAFVIYGNKIAQYNLKGQVFVTVIEDQALADLQRTAFNLAWQSANTANTLPKDHSCGIIPIRYNRSGKREYLAVLHHAGHWDFPKGHPEGKETEKETADRELKEETGYQVARWLDAPSQTIRYTGEMNGQAVDKTVTFFPAEVTGSLKKTDAGIKDVSWFSYSELMQKLTYQNSRELLEKIDRAD